MQIAPTALTRDADGLAYELLAASASLLFGQLSYPLVKIGVAQTVSIARQNVLRFAHRLPNLSRPVQVDL